MKKIFLTPLVALFLVVGTVDAQVNNLPSAGLTPESTFYFLDRLGENLREFFVFNPEAKAKLQIRFAGERISEISVMVEKKGANAKGIKKAKTLLLGNIAYAAEIIKEEKTTGKDISKLAKEIDDAFDEQEKLLVQTFQDARKKLKENRLALKQNLTGIDDLGIETQLQAFNDESNDLKDVQNDLKDLFNDEQKKIEEELNDEDKKEDKLEEVREKGEDEKEDTEIEENDEENESEDMDNEDELDNEDSEDESDSDKGYSEDKTDYRDTSYQDEEDES